MYETNYGLNMDKLRSALAQICEEQQIRPSEYGQRFLLIAAECFLMEAPKVAERQLDTQEWFDVGKEILVQALRDPRARREMQRRSEVSFPILFHTVADAGYKKLAMIGFK